MVKSDMKILFPVSLIFFLYIYTLKFDIQENTFFFLEFHNMEDGTANGVT
jgi:hypothetical protein